MAEPDIEMNASAYEEAYARLHEAFVKRLGNSIQAIDNMLGHGMMQAFSREDLERAQHLAHGLAGSGSTFGFPHVTAAGQKADSLLDRMLKKIGPDKPLDGDGVMDFEHALAALRLSCVQALEAREGDPRPFPFVPASHVSRKPNEAFHVLIADDDEHVASLLSMRLQQKGMQATIAPDGESALRSIRRNRPDLIVLDIGMPGISGHDILRRVKQDADLVGIPILMLTAQADQKDVVSALHSGAIDYVIKPFDPDRLLLRIEKILDAARHTILIADNDPLILQLLESKFRYAGCRIIVVEDGQKAWEKIQRALPDLVILDRMMPGLEGLAVLRNMRGDPATRDTPVIILSARKEDRDVKAGLDMGAQKYMIKPFLPNELVAESLRLLEGKD